MDEAKGRERKQMHSGLLELSLYPGSGVSPASYFIWHLSILGGSEATVSPLLLALFFALTHSLLALNETQKHYTHGQYCV